MSPLRVLAGLAALLVGLTAAEAAPKRIIIVRHGEKQAPLTLCSVGKERAQALAAQYLSPTSPMSLLKGETPAAIMAITLHTLETARPIARAWGMKIATNPLMLTPIRNTPYFNSLINVQNRKVVDDLLTNPRWHGKTVVMVWEHFHIASAALEKEFAGQQVTLRQLMHLDRIKGAKVPDTWPDSELQLLLDSHLQEAERHRAGLVQGDPAIFRRALRQPAVQRLGRARAAAAGQRLHLTNEGGAP